MWRALGRFKLTCKIMSLSWNPYVCCCDGLKFVGISHFCTNRQHIFCECFVIPRSALAKMAPKSTTNYLLQALWWCIFVSICGGLKVIWIPILSDLANDLSFITFKTTKRSTCKINTVSVPILSNSIMNSLWQKFFIHLSVVL